MLPSWHDKVTAGSGSGIATPWARPLTRVGDGAGSGLQALDSVARGKTSKRDWGRRSNRRGIEGSWSGFASKTPKAAGCYRFEETRMDEVCETDGLGSPECWDATLFAVGPTNCDDVNTDNILDAPQLACSDTKLYGPETISFPVLANTEYFVVVDSPFNGQLYFGAYNLKLELTP